MIELRFDTQLGRYYVTNGEYRFTIFLIKKWVHKLRNGYVEEFFYQKLIDQTTFEDRDF